MKNTTNALNTKNKEQVKIRIIQRQTYFTFRHIFIFITNALWIILREAEKKIMYQLQMYEFILRND